MTKIPHKSILQNCDHLIKFSLYYFLAFFIKKTYVMFNTTLYYYITPFYILEYVFH